MFRYFLVFPWMGMGHGDANNHFLCRACCQSTSEPAIHIGE